MFSLFFFQPNYAIEILFLLHYVLGLAAQCIVIGPVCDSGVYNGQLAGGRCLNLTTAIACAVFASL